MDNDILQVIGLANMVRIGTIISIDSEENTAVVVVPEIGATVYSGGTASFHTSSVNRTVKILNHGSRTIKDYFNYDIGEKVICIFPAQVGGGSVFTSSTGYIAGAFFDLYSTDRRPPAFYEKVRVLDFSDGTYIEYNLEDKNLIIECKGDIEINGKNIYLNG